MLEFFISLGKLHFVAFEQFYYVSENYVADYHNSLRISDYLIKNIKRYEDATLYPQLRDHSNDNESYMLTPSFLGTQLYSHVLIKLPTRFAVNTPHMYFGTIFLFQRIQ